MKTPREILLERHQSVDSKLDAVRHQVLASVTELPTPTRPTTTGGILELFLSLRWHLAGMSAVWISIAALNSNPAPRVSAAIDVQNIPSPHILLSAIRENRRLLFKLMEWPVREPAAVLPRTAPQRRGEIQTTIALA
jgi:hypothetical protein